MRSAPATFFQARPAEELVDDPKRAIKVAGEGLGVKTD
jgi:hypothetical protein